MLVLSRRIDEEIIIQNDIVLRILKIENGRVYLGFEAPIEVPITRKEIWIKTHGNQTDKTP